MDSPARVDWQPVLAIAGITAGALKLANAGHIRGHGILRGQP